MQIINLIEEYPRVHEAIIDLKFGHISNLIEEVKIAIFTHAPRKELRIYYIGTLYEYDTIELEELHREKLFNNIYLYQNWYTDLNHIEARLERLNAYPYVTDWDIGDQTLDADKEVEVPEKKIEPPKEKITTISSRAIRSRNV